MRFPRMEVGVSGGAMPRITFFAGLILLALTGCVFVFIFFMGGRSHKRARQEENFSFLLREYDKMILGVTDFHGEIGAIDKELDRLEKKTLGVESWLSVLKRRRNLTRLYPPSIEAYRRSTERAAKAYPWSQPLAALAAAAIVKDRALDNKTEKEARALLQTLSDPVFNDLLLGFHVVLGDFSSPEKAAALPAGLVSDGTEGITFDLALLKLLNNNTRGAAADIQTALNSDAPPSGVFLRFAAEYHYDFGDLSRSAELFSRIETEDALLRQADALWLAGFAESARSIWLLLAEMPPPVSEANSLSLYNMAASAKGGNETLTFLEKLAKTSVSITDSRQYGLIRYSRLLDDEKAVAALESVEQLKPAERPFLDLEIHKRSASQRPLGRQLAETWLLLDRHPDNVSLYNWAGWFIFFQRFYDEANVLLRRAEQNKLAGHWASVYTAVYLMQEGAIDAAENILRNLTGASNGEFAEWPAFANLGLILELKRSPARALEQYALAAAKTDNPQTASRIHVHIARSLAILGRQSEALAALNLAVELDPENLSARLEWERTMFR
jgi:tetratricopeptide (TPR) repeat protein